MLPLNGTLHATAAALGPQHLGGREDDSPYVREHGLLLYRMQGFVAGKEMLHDTVMLQRVRIIEMTEEMLNLPDEVRRSRFHRRFNASTLSGPFAPL
ncbi:MAG: hypothetical protein ACYDGW_08305 [Vulcanimicrobiaceae bacterium]